MREFMCLYLLPASKEEKNKLSRYDIRGKAKIKAIIKSQSIIILLIGVFLDLNYKKNSVIIQTEKEHMFYKGKRKNIF